jgi:hypothetical protein
LEARSDPARNPATFQFGTVPVSKEIGRRGVTAKEKLIGHRKISAGGETRVPGGAGNVRRYRYRTPALTGPWRESHEDAARDAVNAKQAQYDDDQPSGIKWIVPGEIEVLNDHEAAGVRR